MVDYGHGLAFGAFLTPGSGAPGRVVELAMLAEQVGLELVTFQDHPYQPAHLDTATLLAYVAARTGRVRLAANVTNLPLRPPAVLARSVASLDLLSGGRVELGLGAGAFWEAIEAMGGRRLGGAAAVRALDEAIEVIRQVWDTGTRGGVRVEGEYYRVVGAKRGPAPAHPVEIWVGAYKPLMLALTGRRADGWLPSTPYLKPGDLAAGNLAIDEAAEAAGRSPRAVRRMLNVMGEFGPIARGPLDGPAEQWAEELAGYALADGISTFILGSDDPDDLRRFAAEVAPAVRELVAADRATAPEEPADTTGAGAPAAGTGGGGREAVRVAPRVARGAFAVVATPDDGVRRSAVAAWDESTRPSGPARDPERTYTAHEQAAGQHLVDVHDALRGELAQLQGMIDQVAAGILDAGAARSQINTMTVRQNKWVLGTYCESYCRIVTAHHSLEDRAMFPHLRHADRRLAPVLDRLAAEHHTIHDILEQVDRALVGFVGVPDGTDALRAATDLLADALLSHLAYEERELIEPLARLGMH